MLTKFLFKKLAFLNLVLIWLIMLTGAGVRLTSSGLGCETWPKCESDSFAPTVSSFHSNIEWGNRVITGMVSVVVILVLLSALFVKKNKKQIVLYSFLVFIGILIQIVLGGITVLTHLNPFAVGSHLLVSLYLIIISKKLYLVASNKEHSFNSWYLIPYGFLIATVLGGIATTGSGPHAGDEGAQRFTWSILEAARVHAGFAWLTLISFGILVWQKKLQRSTQLYNFFTLIVLQMIVGYTQYILKVPPLLVAIHIAILGLIATNIFTKDSTKNLS